MPLATLCLHCSKELPAGSRSDARYCSVRCRVAAHRAGHRSGPRLALPIRDEAGLWCPLCARPAPFGRLVDGGLVLRGQWALESGTWRWSAWADRGEHRATLPTVVRCSECRTELSVTAAP